MVDVNWKHEQDVEIGDDAYIIHHLESIHIDNAQDVWQSVEIEHKNIALLRDELNKIIKRLDLDQ